jgi:hypothetical protein
MYTPIYPCVFNHPMYVPGTYRYVVLPGGIEMLFRFDTYLVYAFVIGSCSLYTLTVC